MRTLLASGAASAALLVVVSGCSSKTTNGGPYVFQGASDVAGVAHMTGCVSQVGGHGVDPNGYLECEEGDATWGGGGPDDASSITIAADGLSIDGATFEIQCNDKTWCGKALKALIA